MWPLAVTLAMTLTLNFQGQRWNLLYLSQKGSDCHETKSKHIDRTLGLKCDHWLWPWPWPWPWIFKVKDGICYISAKNGLIATKRKANISIELKASNVTIGCDLGHDLDLEFSRSNMEFAISQPKMVWLPWNEKQPYRLNFRPQMWPLSLTLVMTLTLNFRGQLWCNDLPDSDRGDFRCRHAVDSSSCGFQLLRFVASGWHHFLVLVFPWFLCSNLRIIDHFLTHWGRDKIDAILQMMFSNAISWKKMFEFRLKFHWSLFLKVQLTIFQHWFR